MSIRNHIGPFISVCADVIDRLVVKSASDESNSKRLKAAFQNIRDNFLKDLDNFKFSPSISMSLSRESPLIYEELNELVEILQGRSEMYPLAALKIDGAGAFTEGLSTEEQLELRSEICSGVAIKINTVISELSTKRKALAEEASEIKESRKAARVAVASLEARAVAIKARQELRSTEAGCIHIVTENGLELENLEPIFQNNKNVVLAAVRQNGRALQFAHFRLRNDNDVVREALKHPDADFIIEHAGDAFRENREQLLAAIRQNEMAIGYGNDELVEDRAFILDALDANSMVLQLLDESLRNDREIVVRALISMSQIDEPEILLRFVGNELRPFAEAWVRVEQDGLELQNLDPVFRNDREIVLAAVRENGLALQYASEALRNDSEVVAARNQVLFLFPILELF